MKVDFSQLAEEPIKVDFSLMDKQPPDFMVDKTPELSKISGDEPKALKDKVESSQAYSDLTGMSFNNTFDLYDDLPDIKPAFFDVNEYMTSAVKDEELEAMKAQTQNFKDIMWNFTRPFVAEGYVAASALNRGMAGFSEHLGAASEFITDITGLEKGGIFDNAAKAYEQNAAYWAERADEVGVTFIDEMIGEAAGGAIPGIGQFVLDVSSFLTLPFMAGAGADERKNTQYPVASGLTEAAKVGLLHKLFGMLAPLKQYVKAPTMGTVFGFQEAEVAPKGEKARAFAKGMGTGMLYSASSPGGHLGLNKMATEIKPYIVKAKELIVKEQVRMETAKDKIIAEKDKYDKLPIEEKADGLPDTAEKIGKELEKEVPKKGLFKTAIKEVEKDRLSKLEEKEIELREKFYKEEDLTDVSRSQKEEYYKINSEARTTAAKELDKKYTKEDKRAFRSARKEATKIVKGTHEQMDTAVKEGGINLKTARMLSDNQTVNALIRKRPGLFKKDAALHSENLANQLGFDTPDAMFQKWLQAGTKKEAIKRITNELYQEYEIHAETGRDILYLERAYNEEINILNKMLAKKPHKMDKAKQVIRQQTGQEKVKDIVSVDTREALKDQLRAEAKVAREAFREGNLKATVAAKIKQRDILVKMRQQREIKKMRTWLQKTHKLVTKGQQFSKATQKTLEDLYNGLDKTKMIEKKKISLENTKEFLKKNPDTELPERVLKDLERLGKKGMSELTFNEVESLYTAVKHQVHLEKVKNKIKSKRRLAELNQTISKVVSELRPKKDIEKDLIKEQKKARTPETKAQIATKGMKDFLTKRQLGYDTLVEYVFGFDKTGYDVFFRQIKTGTRNRLKYQHDSVATFVKDTSNIRLGKPIDKWLVEAPKVEDVPYRFTRGERMSLYRHSLNADNKAALLEGGFGYKSRPEKNFKITEKQLNAVIADMSKAELQMAGKPVDNFFDNQRKQMNDTFLKKNGYDMPVAKGGKYFPKSPMSLFSGIEAAEFAFKDNMTRVGAPKGRTMKRVGSKAPIFLEDMTQVMNSSMKENSTYAHLELPMSNASKLLYDKRFKKEFLARHDKTTWLEIEKGLRDIIGQRQQFNSFDKTLMFLKGNMATGLLGLNPFVIGIQPASFPLYGIYIEPKYLAKASAEFALHPKKMAKEHIANSPEYAERVAAGYNIDIQDVLKNNSTLFGGGRPVAEKLMTPIQTADKMAVTPGTRAGVLKVLTEIKEGRIDDIVQRATGFSEKAILNMNEAQQLKLAYEFADFVTAKTQPMFSPEHRSSLSRGTAFERTLVMFGSATSRFKDVMIATGLDAKRLKQLQQEAVLKTQNVEGFENRQAAAKARFVKSIFAVLVVNTAAVMTRDEIRNALYNRESKLSFASKILKSWSGLMFGVRDVSNAIFRSLDKGTSYGVDTQMSPISLIPELTARAGFNIIDAIESGDEKAALRAVDSTLNLVLTGKYGLPYQPAKSLTKIGKNRKQRKPNL